MWFCEICNNYFNDIDYVSHNFMHLDNFDIDTKEDKEDKSHLLDQYLSIMSDFDNEDLKISNPIKKSKQKPKHVHYIYKCTHCNFKALYNSQLHQHIRAIHEMRLYSCPYCMFTTKYIQSVKRHIKNVHRL